MMTETNPYQAYTDDAILNSTPIGLVVALYQGAIDSCVVARRCLANRDIPARTKAINKTVSILAELMRTLDDEKGGEISGNLRRLYAYIQGRVTHAHLKQDPAPLEEAERLLSTILEGWKEAGANFNSHAPVAAPPSLVSSQPPQARTSEQEHGYAAIATPYDSYLAEASAFPRSPAYSF